VTLTLLQSNFSFWILWSNWTLSASLWPVDKSWLLEKEYSTLRLVRQKRTREPVRCSICTRFYVCSIPQHRCLAGMPPSRKFCNINHKIQTSPCPVRCIWVTTKFGFVVDTFWNKRAVTGSRCGPFEVIRQFLSLELTYGRRQIGIICGGKGNFVWKSTANLKSAFGTNIRENCKGRNLGTKYKLGPFYDDLQQTVQGHDVLVPTKPSRSSEAIFNLKESFGSKNLWNATNNKRTEEAKILGKSAFSKLQTFGIMKLTL